MKIDTKARLAIAAILDIAIHGTNQPVRMADICQRQRISQSYLEHLLKNLLQHGFVASFRGPGGGYRLARRLATISVADIIGAVDGEASSRGPYVRIDRGPGTVAEVTDGLWGRVDDHLHEYLRSVTLESVLADSMEAENSHERTAVVATVPYIERAPLRHEDRPAPAAA
jgi:Rrf2 family iron-sulfur cluster assembly transcriptional regulator